MGNFRKVKRMMGLMGVDYTLLDNSDVLDSPNTCEYHMYVGGTNLSDAIARVIILG